MAKYTITYVESEDKYSMNGILMDFIGEHFYTIANENNIKFGQQPHFRSESYMLAVIQNEGIEVDLLEEDGSRMIW